MSWHMPWSLRIGLSLVAAALVVGGLFLIIADVRPVQPFDIVLGIVMVGLAAYLAADGWRSALSAAGEVLTVRSAFGSREIQRAEIDSIEADSGGVRVRYVRDGRKRAITSSAGQGVLNSLGGKLFRRETRMQAIVGELARWRSAAT